MATTVTGLHIYPVKSCQGIFVKGSPLTRTGLLFDRHWMIIKQVNGRFVTQRNDPQLSQIEVSLPEALYARGAPPSSVQEPQVLELCKTGYNSIQVPLQLPELVPQGHAAEGIPQGAGLRSGTVWEWTGCCWDEGDAVAGWLSDVIGHPVRLVRFVGDQPLDSTGLGSAMRAVDPAYAAEGHTVAFPDGYPLLLANEASRERLEEEAGIPLSMQRFRPNIVIDGKVSWQEDNWSEVAIGSAKKKSRVTLKLVKPCSRCTVPNVDPATGIAGPETSAALKALRSGENMPPNTHSMHPKGGWQKRTYFGWNSVVEHLGVGYVAVGDSVEVVAERL